MYQSARMMRNDGNSERHHGIMEKAVSMMSRDEPVNAPGEDDLVSRVLAPRLAFLTLHPA